MQNSSNGFDKRRKVWSSGINRFRNHNVEVHSKTNENETEKASEFIPLGKFLEQQRNSTKSLHQQLTNGDQMLYS